MGQKCMTDNKLTAPAVHSLDSFSLSVPDVEEAQRYYEAFGLDVRSESGFLTLRTFGDDHIWAYLREGPAKKLLSIGLGIYDRDREALASRIDDVRIAPADGEVNGLWCQAPGGLPIELAVAAKSSPDHKPPFGLPSGFAQGRGAAPRSKCNTVRPRRLAHIALFTPDVSAAIRFYTERLGLRLSDRSGDDVAFLHGPHGSDHHLVAFARSPHVGLHHSSWDVASFSDVGMGAMQMARAGYAAGWGLGRHVLGSNYFHYVRDPWGSYAEYSADMDFIPADTSWVAGDHPPEDSFFQWGPPPPDDMARNYELP